MNAVESGRIARDDVTELGPVLAGATEGRRSDDETTAFDSTGLAIQDLAIALAAIERAGEIDLPTLAALGSAGGSGGSARTNRVRTRRRRRGLVRPQRA